MKKTQHRRPAVGQKRKLGPMRVSDGFREFVLDQLDSIPGLYARAMFGGVGLYAGDVFFGILASDVLYFKVDASNRGDYEAAGSKPFAPYPDRQSMTMSYYDVPVSVLDNGPTLVSWAERALDVARAARATSRGARPRATRARSRSPRPRSRRSAG